MLRETHPYFCQLKFIFLKSSEEKISGRTRNISIIESVYYNRKSQNPSKAIGPDKISPHFLKEIHHEISPIISDLSKSSVNTVTVPNYFREARVTSVFKKGAKSKPEKYRLINLICILIKSFEHQTR